MGENGAYKFTGKVSIIIYADTEEEAWDKFCEEVGFSAIDTSDIECEELGEEDL